MGFDPVYPCIILAAGASSRMGRHKLLLPLGGEPLIRRVARVFADSCSPVLVITGFGAPMVEKALEGLGGVAIVYNSEWAIGMLSSIRTGISALPSCAQGCLIHHGDVPFIDASTIQTMIAGIHAELEQSSSSSAAPLVASCAGIHGHPAFLPARLFKEVLALDSKETIWGLLERNGCKYIETESYAVLNDVDTLADYRRLVGKYNYEYELDSEAMD